MQTYIPAGSTNVTVSLKSDGDIWSDGSTADLTFEFTINPAVLTATYASETIATGATPAYVVTVTGFVNGETACPSPSRPRRRRPTR